MAETKIIRNREWSEVRFWTLALVAITIPWTIFSNNLAIGTFLMVELALLVFHRAPLKLPKEPESILFMALFLASALGWFSSDNQSEAKFVIERQLVFLLFPLMVPKVPTEKILSAFALFSLSFLLRFFWFILEIGIQIPLFEWFTYLPIHYPYFGIYSSISALFWFWVWGQKIKIQIAPTPLPTILSLLFVGCTMVCHSRNAQLFLLISIVLQSFFLFGNVSWKSMASFLVIAMAGILVLFQFPRFSNFWDALLVKQMSWQCSLEPLTNWKDWLWGKGPGDAQYELQECYYRHQSWFYDFKYNSHNQYFTFLLSSGIIGFVCFIFLIILNFRRAIQTKNYLHFFLAFSLAIASLTESVFLTNKGIIFYSFWLILLSKATKER